MIPPAIPWERRARCIDRCTRTIRGTWRTLGCTDSWGAQLLTVIAEWAATIGMLVHAYRRGGSVAVGFVSIAVLAPSLFCAPIAAALTARHRAQSVRLGGFVVQVVGFAAAAVAAAMDLPLSVVATGVVVGIGP